MINQKFEKNEILQSLFEGLVKSRYEFKFDDLCSKTEVGFANYQIVAEIDIDRYFSFDKKNRSIVFEILNEIIETLENEFSYSSNSKEYALYKDSSDIAGISIYGV